MAIYVRSNHKRILSQASSSFTLICFIVFVKMFVFQLYQQVHPRRPQPTSLPLEEEDQSHSILGRRLLQVGNAPGDCLALLKCLSNHDGRVIADNCDEYYTSCRRRGRRR